MSMSTAIRDDDNVNFRNIHLTQLKYKVAVLCTFLLLYGRTSCDYIGDVTILSWFYDPLSEDSYQAGNSLNFSI